jgi:hypothetical protein
MTTCRRFLAWILVLGQVSWAIPVEAATPTRAGAAERSTEVAAANQAPPAAAPTPTVQPNRQVPKVSPPPQRPAFSAEPTEEEVIQARVFEEPLVPVRGKPTPGDSRALAVALTAYLDGGSGENVGPLLSYLEGHATSPWRAPFF